MTLVTLQHALASVADVLMIILWPLVIYGNRNVSWERACWTSTDRDAVRALRFIAWSAVTVAWIATLATAAHRPALILEPILAKIAFLPLALTWLATILINPEGVDKLRIRGSFRISLVVAAFVFVFCLGSFLLQAFGIWTRRGE
jgi:hypothetical protein